MKTAAIKRNGRANGDAATEGIWYFVYLKPDWMLLLDRDRNASHLQYWRKTVVPMLIDWYKLKKDVAPKLGELSASMPRGRVLEDEGRHGVYHGGDFPKSLSFQGEINKIISGFGISKRYLLQRVDIRYEPHEKMEAAQQKVLQKIIGKLPY